jgi:hypothetical protein
MFEQQCRDTGKDSTGQELDAAIILAQLPQKQKE